MALPLSISAETFVIPFSDIRQAIDTSEVTVVDITPTFTGDFEAGWVDWSADVGLWEVGTPSVVGPPSCFAGTQCAGTVLDGNYPANTTSRLVGASMQMPVVTGFDEIHLRFQNWFAYGSGDSGQVQVSVWDSGTLMRGAWVNEGSAVVNVSGAWTLKDVDLTAYSGERVRIGLLHPADPSGITVSNGWYTDDVTISVF